MKENDILGGFNAVFETLAPNEDSKYKGIEVVADSTDDSDTTKPIELTEEESQYNDPIPGKEDYKVEDNDEETETPTEDDKVDDKPTETEDKPEEVDESETSQVTAFFDAIAEQVGWSDMTDEEKPKSVEDFVAYMKSAVETSSTPQYANDDVAQLDEYIKNGGTINDYFTNASIGIDYDNVDLSDINAQKVIVREFLLGKGFNDVQINRKLEKYEDADLLEDEANDAIGFLKESKEEAKKALLEEQRTIHQQNIEEQQKFYNNVVTQVEALSDIRGIKIPKEDKKTLMEYMFKADSDGRTKYQKDYAKSTKNLIESAYFTMKGDVLLEQAKRSGETSATERLKNTLKSNKISGSKQTINNGSATPLWSIASQQLLRRPQ
jgi:hypothetical protein